MAHELKCWPGFFADVLTGAKTFEVRKHDRPFTEGDSLLLREFDPVRGAYTGRETERLITYVLLGGEFGIERGYCVLGIGLATLFEGREGIATVYDSVTGGYLGCIGIEKWRELLAESAASNQERSRNDG